MLILRHQAKRELLIRSDGFLLLSLRSKPMGSPRDDASVFMWSLSRVLCFMAMFSIYFLTVFSPRLRCKSLVLIYHGAFTVHLSTFF